MAVLIAATCAAAHADVASDQPAAILVFPKVLVDIASPQVAPPAQIDTLIRVTNTNPQNAVYMHCVYIDGTPQCQSDATKSCLSSPFTCPIPGVKCIASCGEEDFDVYLTASQPVAWLASRSAGQCTGDMLPCFPESAVMSLVPPVQEDPFLGELECIEVDAHDTPVNQNDLKGEAEIIRSSPDSVDVESYNAIGFQAIAAPGPGMTTTLTLGPTCSAGSNNQAQPCMGPLDCGANGLCSACPDGVNCSAEYSASPGVLILDHFAEGAVDPVSGFPITTDLTLVPSSRDFTGATPVGTLSLQFLVFNEFEQRLSVNARMSCLHEFKLSDIDGTGSPQNVVRARSPIFGAGTLGTLAAQTRLQAVSDGIHGNALLGIAEEFRLGGGSAAVNLHFSGSRSQSDFIYLPTTP
ncbi:MAG: hypothetical protein ACHQ4J_14685 [Candidatus Binatia bacterium]